jgi:hypothetical protein
MSEPITPDRIRVTADHLEEVGDDLCEWLRKIADRMEKKPEPIKARSDLSHAVQRLAMPIQVSMPTLYRADEDMLMPELRAEYPFRDRREAAWITPPESRANPRCLGGVPYSPDPPHSAART